jgi:signal transduction histidine kinase
MSGDDRLALLERTIEALAHRIRNPMHSMVLALALLREHTGAELRRHVDVIDEDIRRLDQIITAFLRLTQLRLERGDTLDLAGLVDEVVGQWASHAAVGGIELETDLGDAPPVRGDRDLVHEALSHLVSNAIEAAPPGGLVLVRAGASANGGATLAVEDDGPGIEPAAWPRIFEPFFTTKDRHPGIGLPLARGIAALHGGDVTVERLEGRGTRATLLLGPAPGGGA